MTKGKVSRRNSRIFVDEDKDLWFTTKEDTHLCGSAEIVREAKPCVETLIRPINVGRMEPKMVHEYRITFHFPLEEFTT